MRKHVLLLASIASAVLLASLAALVVPKERAEAAFPGVNARIAFERDTDGYRGSKDPEIYSVWFDGTNLKRLTNNTTRDTDPAYSADGRTIAYSGGDARAWDAYEADLFLMRADGSEKTRLTRERRIPGERTADDTQPSFSPGGRQIAFVRNGPLSDGHTLSNNDVYKIGVDGRGLTRLVDIPSYEYRSGCCPAWSPDGSGIAFYSEAEEEYSIETVRPDGSGREPLTTGYSPNWSPDGSQVVFVGTGGGIHKVAADGSGEPQQLLTGFGHVSEPAFSPSGTRIVFSSDIDGDYDLYVIKADGTDEPRRLTNAPGDDNSPDWQPAP